MTDYLVALMGPSGSGKTSISEELQRMFCWDSIESYTTRPRRFKDEVGHRFITEEEFLMDYPEKENSPNFVAYTEFNGYRYFATQSQVNCAEVYVIDPAGVRYLKERYHGPKKIISIWLDADPAICKARMLQRGDSIKAVEKRLKHDAAVFSDDEKANCDHVIDVSDKTPNKIAHMIMQLVIADIRNRNIIHH